MTGPATPPVDGRVPTFAQLSREERRAFARLVVARVLAVEDGMHGAMRYLYRGSTRPDGSRVAWTVTSWEAYRLFLDDVVAARQGELPVTTPVTTPTRGA